MSKELEKMPNHISPLSSSACIGLYCGRTILTNNSLSECGACPAGSRVNGSGICEDCDHQLSFYDWNYLAFMAVLPLGMNLFFIDNTVKKKLWKHLILHLSAILESFLSFLTTLIIFRPMGSLNIRSCESTQLSDWYTIFYNPSPDFIHTIHCTQEAVHPLYSLVFVHYAFSIIIMLLFRISFSRLFSIPGSSGSVYIALYFYPILAFVHTVMAGLIYYSFPYIILVASIITNAVHFSTFEAKLPGSLVGELFSSPRNLIVLLVHWVLHFFGIVSLLDVGHLKLSLCLMALVPLPATLYILTAPFTDPKEVFEMTSLPERRWRTSFTMDR